jgi:hypothetical protein
MLCNISSRTRLVPAQDRYLADLSCALIIRYFYGRDPGFRRSAMRPFARPAKGTCRVDLQFLRRVPKSLSKVWDGG